MSALHRVRARVVELADNHIADRNRFKLAAPPAWWLRALADFDRSLVIIPSRLEGVYWLAQRRPMGDITHQQIRTIISADELMMRQYGLVGVTKLLSLTGQWNWDTNIFVRLAMRAGWRNGLTPQQSGAQADKNDAAEVQARHAVRDDRIDAQIRWSEQVAKWHTGAKILSAGPANRPTQRARLAQRASSEPSTGRTQLATR